MKSTLRVDEIPACAGMKCSRVAPARNTRARLGYVAGLCEPYKLGFSEMNNWIPSNYANAYTLNLRQEVAALLIINGQAGYFHDVQHFFPQAAALT